MLIHKTKQINLKNIKWKSDAIYNSFWISKMVSMIFRNGKKVKVEKNFYKCFYNTRVFYNLFAIHLFFEIIELLKILINVVIIKKVIKNKVIFPKPILFLKQYKKVICTLSESIMQNTNQTLSLKFTGEFMLLLKKQGSLYLKKTSLSKIGCQNQALKRYRWEV